MKVNILIRFSLRFNHFIIFNEYQRERWFAYRSKLFFLTTYKSLMNNKYKNFELFLIFNKGDEHLFAKYLQNLEISPIFADESDYKTVINEIIKDNENTLFLRIDSDDLISENFMEYAVNQILERNDYNGLNYYFIVPRGYFVSLRYFQKYYDLVPSFIFFLKNNHNIENIFDFDHNDIYKTSPIKIHSIEWIQLIHLNNVSNKIANNYEVLTLHIKNLIKLFIGPFQSKYRILQNKSFRQKFSITKFSNFLSIEDWKNLMEFIGENIDEN